MAPKRPMSETDHTRLQKSNLVHRSSQTGKRKLMRKIVPNSHVSALIERALAERRHMSQIGCECNLRSTSSASAVDVLVAAPGCRKKLVGIAERLSLDDDKLEDALHLDQPPFVDLCREICDSPQLKATVLQLPPEKSHSFQTQVVYVQTRLGNQQQRLRNGLTRLIVKIGETSALNFSPKFILHGVKVVYSTRFPGAFGEVFKATYKRRVVAVKQNLPSVEAGDQHLILREAAIWLGLSHERVLPIIGVERPLRRNGTGPPPIWLVSPWMENGTLSHFRSLNGRLSLRKFCDQIVEGMIYLHSQDVVHGDLKAANILIDGDGNIRIADFGLSVFHDATGRKASNEYGAVRWMAPELFTDLADFKRTKESDVYAFACTLLELYTGEVPWFGKLSYEVPTSVKTGLRPDIPCWDSDPQKGVPPAVATIIRRCWEHERHDRLTMEQVETALKVDDP